MPEPNSSPDWVGWYKCDRKHHDKMAEWVDMVMHDPENAGPPPPEWLWMHLRRHSTDPAKPPVPRAKKLMKTFRVTRHRARAALLAEPEWKPTPRQHPADTGPTPRQHPRPSSNADNHDEDDTASTPGRHPADTGANTRALEESREGERDSENTSSRKTHARVCSFYCNLPQSSRNSDLPDTMSLVSTVAGVVATCPDMPRAAAVVYIRDEINTWYHEGTWPDAVISQALRVVEHLDELGDAEREELARACRRHRDPGGLAGRLG